MSKILAQLSKNHMPSRARVARISGALLVASLLFGLLLLSVAPTEALIDFRGDDASALQGEVTVSLNESWLSNDSDQSSSVAWGDVDGDGDLDLAVANTLGQPNKLYLNENGTLAEDASWSSNDSEWSESVAWGDVDGDGDLDLAVGNSNLEQNKLYLNENGTLIAKASWSSDENDSTQSVAWADVDGDGDLDLAVGNTDRPNKLYLNEGGMLLAQASWSSNDSDDTYSVAWADVDGDGDLDLAVGNRLAANKLYLNQGGTLMTSASWSSSDSDKTLDVAWADLDGDGDLDLAVANEQQKNKIYLNQEGTLTTNAVWSSNETNQSPSVAWGDVDNDGDLDLAIGGIPSRLYLNQGGMLTANASWSSNTQDTIGSVAWADVDGDSDLDLVAGNAGGQNKLYRNDSATLLMRGESLDENQLTEALAWGDVDGDGDLDLAVANNLRANQLYLNEGGRLKLTWLSNDFDSTQSLAWADVDGDGDLDLAVGNYGAPNKLYLNQQGTLTTNASWQSNESHSSHSVAWADVDGDGDLDLAVGNDQAPNALYLNEGGMLATETSWSSNDDDRTFSVAWGDVDGDGDLDLAVGNSFAKNKLYLNNEGKLTENAAWSSDEESDTNSVAWADVDHDGDLDLAVGNQGSNELYLNEGGTLATTASWVSNDNASTSSIAWADVDGDADLDLTAANGELKQLYRNENGVLNPVASGLSNNKDSTLAMAWGDVDHDGDLDLAVGNDDQPSYIYLNQRPAHATNGQAHPASLCQTGCRSMGLMLNPEVAPANFHALPDIRNSNTIPIRYTLFHPTAEPMAKVRGFYSLDGGGLWRPAVASDETITSNLASDFAIYDDQAQPIAQNGTLTSSLSFLSFDSSAQVHDLEVSLSISHTNSSQLAAALHTPWPAPAGTTLLLFDGIGGDSPGVANLTLSEEADESIMSASGDVATTVTITPGRTLLSDDVPQILSSLELATVTSTLLITDGPTTIEDLNVVNLMGHHDGDLFGLVFKLRSPAGTQVNLLSVLSCDPRRFTFNLDDESDPNSFACPDDGTFQSDDSLSIFDGEDSNGTWTLITTNTYAPENGGSQNAGSLEGWGLRFDDQTVSTYKLPIEGRYRPVDSLAALRGAPANTPFTLMITDSARIGTLESWGLRSVSEHVYHWDVEKSGLFGKSDNIVFRLEALPNMHPISNSIPGPFQRPVVSAQTYPFRVRGSQVQVLSGTVPVKDALLYRLPAGQATGAKPYANHAGEPFRSDAHGYVAGRGEMAIGDSLIAMLPITSSDRYTIYHTSAAPTENGLDDYIVREQGVQELVVSAHNPLILFDLDFSLEWDARQDDAFLADLEEGIKRASDILYDVSNGQVAIGEVRLHQAKENWLASNIVMYAANNIRPRANMGGIVSSSTHDNGLNGPIQNAYLPGQVRMGPNWDPFGENRFELGEDWWRALAHELAHYLLFLPDNYIGISQTGYLVALDCQGSFMTNTYDDDYSEFLTQAEWRNDCLKSVATQTTGRSDWETISTFYPMLSDMGGNPGPSTRPLDVTQVTPVELQNDISTLPVRYFDLRDAQDSSLLALPQGLGYLFKTRGTSDLTDDIVVTLGSTGANGDRIKVRGAEAQDRVCVFDNSSQRVGCETITESNVSLSISKLPDWQPSILVTPVSSRTFAITVTQFISTGQLNVQLLPAYGSEVTPTLISAPWHEMTPVDPANPRIFTQLITLPYPAFEGFVRVWVPALDDDNTPQREAISQFYLSAAWGPSNRSSKAGTRPWQANTRAWAGNTRAWGAPVASGDGQVTIFNGADPFGETGISALQALTTLPNLPTWLTLVGQGYQVSLLETPTVTRTISFDYLQRDVPDGYEHTLSIYHSPDEGQSWQRLRTEVDREENLAATVMPTDGKGIYALISTLVMPALQPGWNRIGYPLSEMRPPSTALASIEDKYTSVYFNDPATEQWLLHDQTVVKAHPEYASLVNDLTELQLGHSYLLYATEATSLYLPVPSRHQAANRDTFLDLPPATFYGPILPTDSFTPTIGMIITATINETVCGQSTVDQLNGQLVYKIQVAADTGNDCGVDHATVTFTAGGQLLATHLWNNTQAWYQPFVPSKSQSNLLYLPIIKNQ